jgi:hypothetical protein
MNRVEHARQRRHYVTIGKAKNAKSFCMQISVTLSITCKASFEAMLFTINLDD